MTATTATKAPKKTGTRKELGKSSNLRVQPARPLVLPETVACDAQAFKLGLKVVRPCVARDDTRPVLNSVLIEAAGATVSMVACDGFHIAAARTPITGDLPVANHQALLLDEEHADVIATRIGHQRYAQGHNVPARITFQSSTADLVSTGSRAYYQAAGITLNASDIGRVAKGNTRPLPHDYPAPSTSKYPDWRRVLDQPEDKLRAVVRMQVDNLRGIIPEIADYVQLTFHEHRLTARALIADGKELYELTPARFDGQPSHLKLETPTVQTRGLGLTGSEKYAFNARLMRKWLANLGGANHIDVYYYGANRMLYIVSGEPDDSLILEYGIMPMNLR